MSKQRSGLLIGGILVIALALWLSWFFKNFELIEKERRSGMDKTARKNPFYAAELFLRDVGIAVESTSGRKHLIDLPSSNDTLLINDIGSSLNTQRQEALLAWIANGGQLITSANRFWNEDSGQSGNRLLDHLNIRLVEASSLNKDDSEEVDSETQKNNKDRRSKDPFGKLAKNLLGTLLNEPVTIALDNGESVEVLFNSNRSLVDVDNIASYSAGAKDRIHMLDIPIGDGWLTVFSDSQFLKHSVQASLANSLDLQLSNIEQADHAYLLWNLLAQRDKTWLLYSIDALPLHQLLWSRAQLACISFIALLLFWLWWQRNQFGPLKGQLDPPRRNLMEHIRMGARYHWQQDKAQLLLNNNREHIIHAVQSKHPYIGALAPEEQCQYLSETLWLSAAQIHQALYADWRNERDFILISDLLQQIGQEL